MSTHNTATAPPRGDDTAALMVRMSHVRKHFGLHEVLKDITIGVPTGNVLCLLGPSGSGKSTLLRCINQLETIDGGRIEVNGELIGYRDDGQALHELHPRAINRQRIHTGMVFQHFNLFPHLTALQNVCFAPLKVRRESKDEVIERAQALLARVGMQDKMKAYPRQLSGGQQQRVAIARALAMRPALMLFDEPTSALDPELVGEVLEVMKGVADEGMTTIVVTHEIGFAREVADTVVLMDDGVVVESGPPAQVLDNPQHNRTRDFLGKVLI